MKFVICLFALVFVGSLASALSVEDAAAAAKAAGFPDKTFPKTGESYVTSKDALGKRTFTFKTFSKGKSARVDQISLSCNQCEQKKLDQKTSILCYEDIQTIAKQTHVDLPLKVIEYFEEFKTQQQSWDLEGHVGKSLRYIKTLAKCGKGQDESIRFDFFYK